MADQGDMSQPTLAVFADLFQEEVKAKRKTSSKNRIQTQTLYLTKTRPPIKRTCWKSRILKTENVAIYLQSHERQCWSDSFSYMYSRDVQGFVFAQITFKKCTTNFYFQNGKVDIKTVIANLSPVFAFNFLACLGIFMQPRVQSRHIFAKLLDVSESSIKIKPDSHWTLFVNLVISAVICKKAFCMETKLYNISKTANAVMFSKTILEGLYKVLQGS